MAIHRLGYQELSTNQRRKAAEVQLQRLRREMALPLPPDQKEVLTARMQQLLDWVDGKIPSADPV